MERKNHQAHKDQNSNKFCLCTAYILTRQHASGTIFSEEMEVHNSFQLSLSDHMKSQEKKHLEAQAVRTNPEGILHVLFWKEEVGFV